MSWEQLLLGVMNSHDRYGGAGLVDGQHQDGRLCSEELNQEWVRADQFQGEMDPAKRWQFKFHRFVGGQIWFLHDCQYLQGHHWTPNCNGNTCDDVGSPRPMVKPPVSSGWSMVENEVHYQQWMLQIWSQYLPIIHKRNTHVLSVCVPASSWFEMLTPEFQGCCQPWLFFGPGLGPPLTSRPRWCFPEITTRNKRSVLRSFSESPIGRFHHQVGNL